MNRESFFGRIPVITKNLIIINFIMLLASMAMGNRFDFDTYLSLHFFTSPDFNPVQLITHMFMHAGFTHFFFNMFALFMFGASVERVLGAKKFLFYYISCGVGAALIQEAVYAIRYFNAIQHLSTEDIAFITENGRAVLDSMHNFADKYAAELNIVTHTTMVGASGAVYGILLAFGMLFPNKPIYIFFIPVPIKAKYVVAGYGIIEFLEGLSTAADGIAHFAHLGGMLIGIIMILYWKRKGNIYGNFNF